MGSKTHMHINYQLYTGHSQFIWDSLMVPKGIRNDWLN